MLLLPLGLVLVGGRIGLRVPRDSVPISAAMVPRTVLSPVLTSPFVGPLVGVGGISLLVGVALVIGGRVLPVGLVLGVDVGVVLGVVAIIVVGPPLDLPTVAFPLVGVVVSLRTVIRRFVCFSGMTVIRPFWTPARWHFALLGAQ